MGKKTNETWKGYFLRKLRARRYDLLCLLHYTIKVAYAAAIFAIILKVI